jgi:hypothetical protein
MTRVSILVVAVLSGILAGCERNAGPDTSQADVPLTSVNGVLDAANDAVRKRGPSKLASFPDRGSLIAYDPGIAPVRHGAYTAQPVQLSEAYALRSIADGSMLVNAPNGEPIRLEYKRHLEHADGNWTWIGRPAGAAPGTEAILTFGEKAVFGSIPYGDEAPLQLATTAGRTWIVQTDKRKLFDSRQSAPDAPDFVGAPVMASASARSSGARMAAAPRMAAAGSAAGPTTVDLVVGYTTAFATRLGGRSQALTRLNFMVDIANQAYANSEVNGRVRLVHAVEVDYPDATSNRSALFQLSGVQCTSVPAGQLHLPDGDVNCTPASPPAELQPLLQAREQYRADLVSLVRTYQVPENQSCGVAWVVGGGQQPIDADSAAFALSVVSDSSGTLFPDGNNSTCRNETLVHELGHNMGLVHDRESAQGSDDTNGDGDALDPEEYGNFPYAFGYRTDVGAGNFSTIMALRTGSQDSLRIFSNPRIATCGGSFACGVDDVADNVRALEQTMPLIAAFRTARVPMDFNGDGASDVMWRNTTDGRNTIWRSANSATEQAVATLKDQGWKVAGSGDFDGDGNADVFWRNSRDGRNSIWFSGSSSTAIAVTGVTSQAWRIVGVGDFNADSKADVLWRNAGDGRNVIWLSGNPSTQRATTAVTDQAWTVAGVGDFNADGASDIFWRNTRDGRNVVWLSGNSGTPLAATGVTSQAWKVSGVGDFNADGNADLFWRNTSNGRNTIWLSVDASATLAVTGVTIQAWQVAGVGDYNADGRSDLLWRNGSDGRNAIWLSGISAVQQPMAGMPVAWAIGH